MEANDCVLITAQTSSSSLQYHHPRVQRQERKAKRDERNRRGEKEEEEGDEICGGSGFVWNSSGMIMTSATWLANILTLRSTGPDSIPSGVEWELTNPNTIFHIVYQNTGHVTPNVTKKTKNQLWYQSGLRVVKGEVVSVILLPDVWQSLTGQLPSLGQWRCGVQNMATTRGERGGGGGGEDVPLESLLLHLCCVVMLRVDQESCKQVKRYTPPWRTSGRPRVGERMMSISTPYSTYCPEVFHNIIQSGLVCKLIGRDGAVFITDACHLPHTEGAGLTRYLTGEVIAMVITPLFSERGHPTGLSLAATLSSLPPPSTISSTSPPSFTISSTSTPSPSTISTPNHYSPHLVISQHNIITRLSKMVVAVESGSTWGSGILIATDRVLTCAHVIKSTSGSVKVHVPFHSSSHSGSVLIWNQDMDVAILKLKPAITNCTILTPLQDQFSTNQNHNRPIIYKGRPIYAIGYESPPGVSDLRPLVTMGEVGRVGGGEGVMMVTSAVVCPGMSGGLVASKEGHLLAMIVSISEDTISGHTYPYLNYSLSLPWLLQIILTTRDSQSLERILKEKGETIKNLWFLGLNSKL